MRSHDPEYLLMSTRVAHDDAHNGHAIGRRRMFKTAAAIILVGTVVLVSLAGIPWYLSLPSAVLLWLGGQAVASRSNDSH